MSYSRWSNSCWYTSWMVSNATKKEDELLAIWYSIDSTKEFKYSQLPLCQEGIIKLYSCSKEEADELMEYMEEFKKDCDKEYQNNVRNTKIMNRKWKDSGHDTYYYYQEEDGLIIGQVHKISHTTVWISKIGETLLGQYIELEFSKKAIEQYYINNTDNS